MIYLRRVHLQEKARVRGYHNLLHSTAFAVFQAGLKLQYGIETKAKSFETPEVFNKNEYGKPEYIEKENIYFNISHCNGIVACVFGNTEIGVDVERVRKIGDTLIRKVLSKDELADYYKGDDLETRFFRYWTLKESYVKAIGKGLAYPLAKAEFFFDDGMDTITGPKGYQFWSCEIEKGCLLSSSRKIEKDLIIEEGIQFI